MSITSNAEAKLSEVSLSFSPPNTSLTAKKEKEKKSTNFLEKTYLSRVELQFEDGFDLVLFAPPSRRLEHRASTLPSTNLAGAPT